MQGMSWFQTIGFICLKSAYLEILNNGLRQWVLLLRYFKTVFIVLQDNEFIVSNFPNSIIYNVSHDSVYVRGLQYWITKTRIRFQG